MEGLPQKFRESCAVGDPHYNTFDGTYYDYQGTCPYIYSQTCRQPKNAANYTLKAKNKLYPYTKVSYISEIELEMHGIVIHVDESFNFYVNGILSYFPYSYPSASNPKITAEFRGGSVYIENSDYVQITFGRQHLCIRVPETDDFTGKGGLCGFAGDIDNTCANDIVSRQGDVLTNDKCSYGTDPVTLEKLSRFLDTWQTTDFQGFCKTCEKECIDGGTISPEIPSCTRTRTNTSVCRSSRPSRVSDRSVPARDSELR
ncbi:hypothetical protein L596_000127 [Steinernema carpocapsae]|uniref:VWFD domain-containing protein n=1 Tax=Steinernema carpocapsae TaxID=34508 RepID=A0A4U8UHY9_STECR|nr:hypothetical protein L596_000127 [Steinernema carpocapsae]